jgi:16S rRNA (cytosine967-C5)-methyltransferase
MFNPREAALNSLLKWDTTGAFSNLEINTVISRIDAKGEDISLYTFLFLGVIEKKMLLDSVIKKYSKTNFDEIDVQALNILRLGIYQLLFADRIPDYSAVDESVSLAPKKLKGFVNAILRSFIRDGKKVSLPSDKWQKISLEGSIPSKLVDLFIDSYGEAVAEEICTYKQEKSHTCLRVNTLKTCENEVISKITIGGYLSEKSKITDNLIKTDAPISALK